MGYFKMENDQKQPAGKKLLLHFTWMLFVFTVVTVLISGMVTYSIQMRTYMDIRRQEIVEVGAYLENMIQNEGTDFVYYTQYYKDHYKELRIPYDFDEFQTAYKEFSEAFVSEYPGMALHRDIEPYELSDELQLKYYTYRHEYWLLKFEEAEQSYNLPYVYFLTLKEDIHEASKTLK